MHDNVPRPPDALDDELASLLDFERAVADCLALNRGRSGGGSR